MAIFVSGFILGKKIQKKLEAHLHNSMPNSKETVFSFSFSTSIVKN